MATQITGVFEEETEKAIKKSKVLVVGAGGIGCELLKNLVLTGFHDIEIIDLDTIDVSNLNRQFLFQKKHVGKSKAMVARETALKFNPLATIVAYHDSVISEKYGLNFIKRFTLVLNALDNLSARSHVNRLCLAGAVPLVESGTAGYEGQAELILKGHTKCYDCDPKVRAATYPACTIRNTPTELVHCVVWAKCLFNQLYGEIDGLDDEDVSPDLNDPELAGEAEAVTNMEKQSEPRVSTRAWAEECGYSAEKLFTKLFTVDIRYLLKMTQLWEKRRQPQPLVWGQLPDTEAGCSTKSEVPQQIGLKDQRCWSVAECVDFFTTSIDRLKQQLNALKAGDHLVWDKDDQDAMDFVAACANIRAHIFSIGMKSRFDIKSMAGNIIPAIATTNAIVSGLVVLHALNIVCGRPEDCASVYLRQRPNHRGQLIMPEKVLNPPNKKCYVCSEKPEVTLCVDVNKMSLLELEEAVLKKTLNLAAPDVVDKGSGSILLSSEEGETTANHSKKLVEMGVRDGTILAVDDFLQKYELRIIISQREIPRDGPDFVVVADPNELKASNDNVEEKMEVNGKEDNVEGEEDDDLIMMSDVEEEVASKPAETRKRKTVNADSPLPKKRSNLETDAFESVWLLPQQQSHNW